MALESLVERGAKTVFIGCLQAAEQCYDAIEASNGHYDDVKFVAFDTGTKLIQWMRKDGGAKLLGAIAQDAKLMGYKAVESAIKLYEGETNIDNISIDGIWWDANNVDEMIEKGIVTEG